MGAKDEQQADPACLPKACAIQDCLKKHNYQEEKCRKQIDALYECCNSFYQEHGDKATSVCCPKYDLLKLKMKQRSEGV